MDMAQQRMNLTDFFVPVNRKYDQVILERHVRRGLAVRRLTLTIRGIVDGFSEL
jgi:hypothetical protein